MDDFNVETVYEQRTYERDRFSFTINGKEYKGNFHDGHIQWLHPHPKQDLTDSQLKWLESEVHRLVSGDGEEEDFDEFEVEPLSKNKVNQAHQFKLNIDGEKFKGMVRNEKLEWFHPTPRRKLHNDKVEKVEKQVQEKVKKQIDEQK